MLGKKDTQEAVEGIQNYLEAMPEGWAPKGVRMRHFDFELPEVLPGQYMAILALDLGTTEG